MGRSRLVRVPQATPEAVPQQVGLEWCCATCQLTVFGQFLRRLSRRCCPIRWRRHQKLDNDTCMYSHLFIMIHVIMFIILIHFKFELFFCSLFIHDPIIYPILTLICSLQCLLGKSKHVFLLHWQGTFEYGNWWNWFRLCKNVGRYFLQSHVDFMVTDAFMHGSFSARESSTGHTRGCAAAGGTGVMLRHLPTHCLWAISEAPIPKMLPDPLTQAPEARQWHLHV